MVRLKPGLWPGDWANRFCLNSTMVRLKQKWNVENAIEIFRLNSTMVRLKLELEMEFKHKYNGLNSTMVRLKLIPRGLYWPNENWSQFHYGSIKTH